MRANVVFAVGMWFCALAATALGQEADYPIQPHAEAQELLAKWADTATPAQLEEHYALLAPLKKLAAEDCRQFEHCPLERRGDFLVVASGRVDSDWRDRG
jgi:hypothetical protein